MFISKINRLHKQALAISVFLFFINALSAQTVVSLADGQFIYRLTVEQLPAAHYMQQSGNGKTQSTQIGIAVGTVKSITIVSMKDTNRKQVIVPSKNETPWPWTDNNKGEKFIIEDMNFDGNNDIRLLNSADHYTYYCWMYQPATGQFIQDTALSKFVNPQFDRQQKMVYLNSQGVNTKGTQLYQYIDGKLTLMEDDETSNDYMKETTTITVTKRVNGKMQVVKKVEIPIAN